MSNCIIRLDNYEGQYYPGDPIIGKVICSFNTSKNIRVAVPAAQVQPKHHQSQSNHDAADPESAAQFPSPEPDASSSPSGRAATSTVDSSAGSVASVNSNEPSDKYPSGQIGSGRHEYPFTFQLSHHLPSTYQGHYGGVTFTLKVKVDIPFKFDFTDSMQITVASPVNFNLIKDKLQLKPICYSTDKTVCCWCCASGPITMEVHLEKEAFVVGEVAKLRVDIDNMSNERVESVLVNLIMKIKSKVSASTDRGKSNRELLAINSYTGVAAHSQRSYDLNLEIPQSAQVPNFDQCKLFSQETKLEVTAVIPECLTNMKAVSYVTLGHIPIDGFSENQGDFLMPTDFSL
ncbi:arrestin domain-containing protein 3-like [Anoplophora glabripennis]|uniref:arrestin domain-containing protein 3-like n=1 Tax=Anoplophora glabripennis TaxID=217634 RepID=UPI000C78B07F|nr:arrestin domain-containing protein 3-like [Anoplophora glabripennis]